jgi:hypothetical protein
MIFCGDKVVQLAVNVRKVLMRCNSWGQNVVSPKVKEENIKLLCK